MATHSHVENKEALLTTRKVWGMENLLRYIHYGGFFTK
jgi:hypothetical protein